MSSGADFALMRYAGAGMAAQRAVLNLDAENVARSQAASPGHPIREMVPVLSTDDDPEAAFADVMSSFGPSGAAGADEASDDFSAAGGNDDVDAGLGFGSNDPPGIVHVSGVKPGRAMTGTDAVTEMVNVLNAQRAYEADASVFDTGKALVQRTIDLERS